MDVRGRLEVALGGAEYRLLTRGAARLLGFTESEAVIGGVRVPFLARGWGIPIVLVHGFAADKESWLQFAGAIRRTGRSVIIPDLPGFGAAGGIPPEKAAAVWQARVLAGLLDRLGYARAHFIGNSMGGGISLRFAQDYPERVTSMTLIGSVGPLLEKSEMAIALENGQNPLLLDSPEDLERMLRFVLEKRAKYPRAMTRYIAHARFAQRDAHSLLFRGWIDPKEGEGVPDDLESIATPTLVIHGERDRIIHASTARALAARLPNARLEMLAGIGHVPQMEAPRYVAKLVNEFMDAAEAARTAGRDDALAEGGAAA